jgi:hypothetical protein
LFTALVSKERCRPASNVAVLVLLLRVLIVLLQAAACHVLLPEGFHKQFKPYTDKHIALTQPQRRR